MKQAYQCEGRAGSERRAGVQRANRTADLAQASMLPLAQAVGEMAFVKVAMIVEEAEEDEHRLVCQTVSCRTVVTTACEPMSLPQCGSR